MATTDAEMLALVNAAITELLSGNKKSITIGDRSFTRLDLGELREWRKELQASVDNDINVTARGRKRVNLSNFT